MVEEFGILVLWGIVDIMDSPEIVELLYTLLIVVILLLLETVHKLPWVITKPLEVILGKTMFIIKDSFY